MRIYPTFFDEIMPKVEKLATGYCHRLDEAILRRLMKMVAGWDIFSRSLLYERFEELAERHFPIFWVEESTKDELRQFLAAYDKSDTLTPGRRFAIMQRDGFRCQICGRSAQHGATLEIDHKIPCKRGGSNTDDNLWTLCFKCNRGKGSRLIESIIKIDTPQRRAATKGE